MAELYIPGGESAHSSRQIELPGNTENGYRKALLSPTNYEAQRESLELFEATIVEVGLEGFDRQINPTTGEYEFLAPNGYEFVVRGKMDMWRRGPSEHSRPTPSEQNWNEEAHGGGFLRDEIEPFGSEFRGARLSVNIGGSDFNPRSVAKVAKYTPHYNHDRERTPKISVGIKGQISAGWSSVAGETLPFDLEGRPNSMTLPDNFLTYKWTEVEGLAGEVDITLEPVADAPIMLQIGVPNDMWADQSDDLWLPHENRMSIEREKKRDRGLLQYQIDRAGGTIEALFAYYRRMGSPYIEDPLWRAKDLRTYSDHDDDFDAFIAKKIVEMPEGNQDRTVAEKVFLFAVGSLALVHEHDSQVDDDSDRF